MKKTNIFYHAFSIFAFAVLMSYGLQGCRANKSVAGGIKPMFAVIVHHDTVRPLELPKRALTASQLQDFIRPFFQMNIDTFITPKLDKLTNVISSQANAIDGLNALIMAIRERSISRQDSLMKENEYYKNGYLNSLKLTILYQKQILQNQTQQSVQNTQQIKGLNKIVNIILVIGILIILAVFSLWMWVLYIWSKIKKYLHYA